MPKTTLGIQVLSGELLAVRVRSGWRGAAVEQVARLELPQAGTESSPSPAADALSNAELTVAALSADEVFRREVVVPFSDQRRIEAAAPLEAEESLPIPLEELVCDAQVLARSAGRTRVLVVAAPIERVGRLLGALQRLSVSPQAIDVEALALATVAGRSTGGDEGTSLVVDLGPRLVQAVLQTRGAASLFHAFSARASDAGLAAEVASFLDHLRQSGTAPERIYLSGLDSLSLDEEAWSLDLGVPVRRLPFPRSGVQAGPPAPHPWPAWAIPLGLALRAASPRSATPVNLLRGPYAPAGPAAPWRQTAGVAGAAVTVLLALWSTATWLDASNRAAKVRVLDEAIRTAFQTALPEVKNLVSAPDQLKAKVSELEDKDRRLAFLAAPEASPVRVLRELSAALPRDIDVELRDLAIDERRVRMEGSAKSFRDSERIKAAVVAADPRFASVASDAKDGAEPGEVLFTLTIDLGEKAP